jgi:hypothetical protein
MFEPAEFALGGLRSCINLTVHLKYLVIYTNSTLATSAEPYRWPWPALRWIVQASLERLFESGGRRRWRSRLAG